MTKGKLDHQETSTDSKTDSLSRRSYLTTIGGGSAIALAGCTGSSDNGNGNGNESDDGSDNENGSSEYHGAAEDYLLTVDEMGDEWEGAEAQTRDPDISPSGMESGRATDLETDEGELSLVVMVFDSVENAEVLLSDQRDSYEAEDLEAVEQEIGNKSISTSYLGTAFLDIIVANVYIQLSGPYHINELRGVASKQISKITE